MGRRNGWVVFSLLLLSAVTAAVYGRFLESPIIFDDMYFFLDEGQGIQPIDHLTFSLGQLRSLPYSTLTWSKHLLGPDLIYYRLGNLLLHLLTVWALYGLLKVVFSAVYSPEDKSSLSSSQTALLGAALFALHPVATYAVGYLVQRTILMATFFCIACMLVYAYAYVYKKPRLLWLSVPLYYLALFSKEHAVMLFAIPLALSVLLDANWRTRLKAQWGVLASMLCISLVVAIAHKELLGTTYEIEAKRMLGDSMGPYAYPLSVMTQCGLFFKYVMLWILPNINWMSIDMREPFAASIWGWGLGNLALFFLWGAIAIRLTLKRGHFGLLGLAMFTPWVLFFTELSTVRIQEPFVLYRSYLWAVGGLFVLPLLVSTIHKRTVAVLSVAVLATFSMLSLERLITLSQPILLWDDALKLVAGRIDVNGVDRIHYNLGVNYLKNSMVGEAQTNIKKAIAINPDFAPAHAALGSIYNMRSQWREAVMEYTLAQNIDERKALPPNWRYFLGRARAYESAGEPRAALQDYAEACRLDLSVCDTLRKSAVQK